VRELGPLNGRPVVVVDVEHPDAFEELGPRLPVLPCVVVGVGTGDDVHPAVAANTDILLTGAEDATAPWVSAADAGAGGIDESIGVVTDAAERSPQAAVTLAQVLRTGRRADVRHAIALESLAYGLLQSGPDFAAWLESRTPKAHKAAEGPVVLLDRNDDKLTITLNRPEVHNAYDAAMRDALVEALQLVVNDPSITAVDLRGAGPSFSSGGDLAEFGTTPDPSTAHLIRTTRSAAALLAACADRVTAHVQGACVGAGVELPAFASHITAGPGATFSLPEVGMGLIPGAGGTASIPRRIGRHRARLGTRRRTPVGRLPQFERIQRLLLHQMVDARYDPGGHSGSTLRRKSL